MTMPGWNRKTPFQKEWEALCKREMTFLERRRLKKETVLNQMLAQKVPEKLQHTLDSAFEKAFLLIFEKGTGIIEKTYRKEDLKNKHKINLYADELYQNRKSLRVFSKNAAMAGVKNQVISGAAGMGMGFLGIGLPDIPVFTAMILKCIYEIALHYGFEYDSDAEKYFILLVIEGAVSYGEHLMEIDQRLEDFIRAPQLLQNYQPREQIAKTSGMLSKELLYMKFLQGIPVVGVVGGAYDVIYMKQICAYAKMKYQKRFLYTYKIHG